jgi:molybdenum cofactor guanylyltransferase
LTSYCLNGFGMATPAQFDSAQITAAILAGGEGKRLGCRDKGLEPLAGRPLIAHVTDALRQQAGNLLICINRNNAQYATFGVVCTDGASAFRGPLAGIASAGAASTTPWLLTVPVDCPCPLRNLARRLRETGARVAVAHDGQRRQPLFALYARDALANADSALGRDLPVWRWQDELGAVEVDFSDTRQSFVNLNSAEEFRRWEAAHAG